MAEGELRDYREAPATCFDFPLLKDEVTAIVQDAVLTSLEGNVYDHAKVGLSPAYPFGARQARDQSEPTSSFENKQVNDWISAMSTACVTDLKQLCPNFKYIVTCFVRQRRGGGLEMNSTAFWDEKADGA